MKLFLCSLLAATMATGAETSRLRFNSIHTEGSNVVLQLAIPPGLERVTVEARYPDGPNGWIPVASWRVTAPAERQLAMPLPIGAGGGLFRAWARQWDALPASFYSGQTDFSGQWSAETAQLRAESGLAAASLGPASAGVYLLSGGESPEDTPTSLDENRRFIVPVGTWLIQIGGTELQVESMAEPGQVARRYVLDSSPVLGAVLENTRIHLLQGRSAPSYFGLHSWLEDIEPAVLGGLWTHTIIETTNLPDLKVLGQASLETPTVAQWAEASPLWLEPGLLVWRVDVQRTCFPNLWVSWTAQLPARFDVSHQLALVNTAFEPTGAHVWRGHAAASRLLAVDVNDRSLPRLLSESQNPAGESAQSKSYSAGNLVFQSHTTTETRVVSTNSTLQTNFVPVTLTNLIHRTNYVRQEIVGRQTNSGSHIRALRLHWPDPIEGSEFTGGWSHGLGLSGSGTLWSWGDNQSGSVGPGPAVVATPSPVPLPSPIRRVAASDWRSFALDELGRLWQWGDLAGPAPPWPEETTKPLPEPMLVPLSTPVVELAAGGWHVLALAADGRLWTWGHNDAGALGYESGRSETPRLVQGRFRAAAGGWLHSLAIDSSGHVHSWGWNEFGQLGRDGSPDVPAPVPLPHQTRFTKVAAGAAHSLALSEDGVIWGWGHGGGATLGLGPADQIGPMPVTGLPAARDVACGLGQSLALGENGEVWIFGHDPQTAEATFARIVSLTNVVKIGAGRWDFFALTASGDLFKWGAQIQAGESWGEPADLAVVNSIPVVRWQTNSWISTNIVVEEEIKQEWHPVLLTNAIPVYRDLTRHWLSAVDFANDATSPIRREPVSLPGPLQGISHEGVLLYTLGESVGPSGLTDQHARLSVLAYDGLRAHLIVATNLSRQGPVSLAVRADGMAIIARTRAAEGPWIECWRLNGEGVLERIGETPLSATVESIRILDDIAVVGGEAGIQMVDIDEPTAPVGIPLVDTQATRDIARVTGNRQLGFWIHTSAGARQVWRP